jgi:glycosyltransferase involved in cell wall biosynthesis
MRVVVLPANQNTALFGSYEPGKTIDHRLIYLELARRGIETKMLDPATGLWRKFARSHSFYKAIDPFRALRVMLFERRCDAALSFFESSSTVILLLRRLLRFKAPVMLFDIGLSETWRPRKLLLAFIVPRADAIFVLGSSQVDYIKRRWRTNAVVEFLLQSTDTDFYSPAESAPNGPILSVGDDAGRDYGTLLQALDGMGAPVIIKSRMVTEDKARRPNIDVISSRLNELEFRDLYIKSRFVVIPVSDQVTASGITSVLEAMAMGKALIVSNSTGLRDYLSHEETCLLVPCGDAGALRAAIVRLSNEPETCERLGANARRFVEQHCTRAALAARLEDAMSRIRARSVSR